MPRVFTQVYRIAERRFEAFEHAAVNGPLRKFGHSLDQHDLTGRIIGHAAHMIVGHDLHDGFSQSFQVSGKLFQVLFEEGHFQYHQSVAAFDDGRRIAQRILRQVDMKPKPVHVIRLHLTFQQRRSALRSEHAAACQERHDP